MRLILKVAAGVFLGIMGVLVVLAIPKWREHSRAANATRIMALLTPEQVISRCGKPTTDEDTSAFPGSDGTVIRSMVYDGLRPTPDKALRSTAVLNFLTSNTVPHWLFMTMAIGTNGETRAVTKIEDPVEQLEWLPCLAKK